MSRAAGMEVVDGVFINVPKNRVMGRDLLTNKPIEVPPPAPPEDAPEEAPQAPEYKRKWTRHGIYIIVAFVAGFILLTALEAIGTISSAQQQRFNVILNFLAIVYAVVLVREVEEGWISKVERLREAGIEINRPEDAAVEFFVQLKPYMDAIKEAGIKPDDVTAIMKNLFRPAEKLPGGDIIDIRQIKDDPRAAGHRSEQAP